MFKQQMISLGGGSLILIIAVAAMLTKQITFAEYLIIFVLTLIYMLVGLLVDWLELLVKISLDKK